MSSKSRKKDLKKSRSKIDKIELEEIAAEDFSKIGPASAAKTTRSKTSPEIESAEAEKVNYKVKVIPALTGKQADEKYEEAVTALLNSDDLSGYKLLTVLPSGDSQKFVAFFRFKK